VNEDQTKGSPAKVARLAKARKDRRRRNEPAFDAETWVDMDDPGPLDAYERQQCLGNEV
jgi:hypothetical protein